MMKTKTRRIVVFDLGGVLIDWNPRHLFKKIAPHDSERIELFLRDVCHQHWNEEQDGGLPFKEAIEERIARFPEWKQWIELYWQRWPEMLGEHFPEMVAELKRLKSKNVPCFALTNWSAETFPFGRAKFDFLALFDGILVSGEEKMKKPDPRIFKLLCDRFGFSAEEAVFIDDVAANVEAAHRSGFDGIHHTHPEKTLNRLRELGF